MLWINGYTSQFVRFLNLARPPEREYWAKDLRYASEILKDWSWMFIHPDSNAFTSARRRFEAGYTYAAENDVALMQHVLLSGNCLQIVSHSYGMAFAEGLAAYLFEERGVTTELAVHLQGAQMGSTPQCKAAIAQRVILKTEGDIVANKRKESPLHADVIIVEKALETNFLKYDFQLPRYQDQPLKSAFFIRGNYTRRGAHLAHCNRQFQIWNAVSHGLKLLNHHMEVESNGDSEFDTAASGILKIEINQN